VTLSPTDTSHDGRDVMTVEMEFKAGDPPEGVARVIEQFTNSITIGKA
jgi:hypothetical protein